MNRYPQSPGFKGSPSGPGADAARAYEPQVSGRRRQVLDGLRGLPNARGTAEQIGERINLHWYLTRPRLSELKALGLVIETGDRARSALGGKTTVWRETTADEQAEAVNRLEVAE